MCPNCLSVILVFGKLGMIALKRQQYVESEHLLSRARGILRQVSPVSEEMAACECLLNSHWLSCFLMAVIVDCTHSLFGFECGVCEAVKTV